MNRSRADGEFASLTVPSRAESAHSAASFLVQAAKDMQVPLASNSVFELAIVEALNNAVKHGNSGRHAAVIVCELECTAHRLTVRILDEGPGFDLQLPSPRSEPTELMSVPASGYGLSIIHRVFSTTRTILRDGQFGLEMSVTLLPPEP